MGNLKEIVGIKSDADFQTLVNDGSITYTDTDGNEQVIEYSEDSIYFTPAEDSSYTKEEIDTIVSEINKNIPSTEGLASETYVDTKVANLVNSAPETLDTLGELATAITENESVVDALNSAIGSKASQSDLDSIATEVDNKLDRLSYQYTKTIVGDDYGSGGIGGTQYIKIGTMNLAGEEIRVEIFSAYRKNSDEIVKHYAICETACMCAGGTYGGSHGLSSSGEILSFVNPIDASSSLYYVESGVSNIILYCMVGAECVTQFNITSSAELSLSFETVTSLPTGAIRVTNANSTALSSLLANKVSKSGDTMTGDLSFTYPNAIQSLYINFGGIHITASDGGTYLIGDSNEDGNLRISSHSSNAESRLDIDYFYSINLNATQVTVPDVTIS